MGAASRARADVLAMADRGGRTPAQLMPALK